ncbi:LacI family DNA-binding transcriptional regulator [Aestuariispira insulae]|uniref:LacI family transcriptional regulator n=1 Tax=Aestuariispira insulae TaxID=1461337 RepID=A0A3D9HHS5_9PROT|nr:LacI family DNA-binding transcriptional regulator [Aestuariispira insulae]RED49047.1 LacI family transcriptional regulator [Aestuariispira insulae]
MTTTIRDVAARAGVSVGTVSRVLSKNDTVKPRLREKVEQAVRDLNYKPNHLARAFRMSRSDVIGLIVPDITNPFFAELAKHVETVAAARGLFVMLANTHDDPLYEKQQIENLLERSPRGILVVSATDDQTAILETDIPIVAVDRQYARYPAIATDHEWSASLAALHLLENGHSHIAYIAGPEGTAVARARESGFRAGIEKGQADTGLAVRVETVRGAFDFATGEELGRELLQRPVGERPTAIATASDQQAIGVMRAARDLDLQVPQDLSVVGFDDIPLAGLVTPRLTTIRQSVAALAEAAIDAVLDPRPAGSHTQFPGRLIVRGSSGPVA